MALDLCGLRIGIEKGAGVSRQAGIVALFLLRSTEPLLGLGPFG